MARLTAHQNRVLRPYVNPRLTKYIRCQLTPRQRAFLCLKVPEAFYGGAARSGKTESLLAGALQHVDVPFYSALILRRTIGEAEGTDSILHRARVWLHLWPEVRWNQRFTRFEFPSGAILQFGYLAKANDRWRYDSSAYQYVAFDELTHWPSESDYEHLFTRMSRPKCPKHSRPVPEKCALCERLGALNAVPLRMRSASNPGGRGHRWVRDRFMIQRIPGETGPGGYPLFAGRHPTRIHVPAFVQDNPYVDVEAYIAQVTAGVSDPVLLQQRLSGNWAIQHAGRFQRDWPGRYSRGADDIIYFGRQSYVHEGTLEQFVVIDSASTRKTLPGGEMGRNPKRSWTVMVRFGIHDGQLIVLDMRRFQEEVPHYIPALRELIGPHGVYLVAMELTAQSTHLFQLFESEGFPMLAMTPRSLDKVQRSVAVQSLMARGRVWLPKDDGSCGWLSDVEDELFTWTGDPDEDDDIVDCFSYAGIYLTDRAVGGESPRFARAY